MSARSATAATCSVAAVASASAVRAASIASASVEAVACASRAPLELDPVRQRVDGRVELGQRGLRRGGCLAHRPCLRRGRFGRRGELRDLARNGDRVELGHDLGGAAGACVGLRDRRDELLVARACAVEVVMQLEQAGAPRFRRGPGGLGCVGEARPLPLVDLHRLLGRGRVLPGELADAVVDLEIEQPGEQIAALRGLVVQEPGELALAAARRTS